MLLKYKKCVNPIEREMATGDTPATWPDMDIMAINYHYSAFPNKVLEYVKDLETSRKIIVKLDEMYEPSTSLQMLCRNKLEIMKLPECPNCDQFFDRSEKATNELIAAGASV